MLAAGPTTVATIEALDRTGLWGRLFPEWGAVRDLPPRDVVAQLDGGPSPGRNRRHRQAPFTTRVARSDLLVLGALLHDIGKGRGVDHCVLGAELATQIGDQAGAVAPGRRDAVQAWCATTCCCPRSRPEAT